LRGGGWATKNASCGELDVIVVREIGGNIYMPRVLGPAGRRREASS